MVWSRGTSRRVAAVALPLAVLGAVGIGAATALPASAKSDVLLSADRASVRSGETVVLTATGDDDAAGGYTLICLQTARHHRWADLRCSRPVADETGGSTLVVRLRWRDAGDHRLRARLFDVDSRGGHAVVAQVSPVEVVRVR